MNATDTLIPELIDHYRDPQWLKDNADQLLVLIEGGLKAGGDDANRAIRNLLLVYPHVFDHEDLKQWTRLVEFAIRKYVPAPDTSRDLKRPEFVINSVYTLRRLDHTPPIPTRTKRRRRVRTNPRELYEGYIILMASLFFRDALTFDQVYLNEFLEFTRRINNQYVYHKAYQTLAFIFAKQGEMDRAMDMAMMAYRYFVHTDNVLETALSALAIAKVHHGMEQNFDEAMHWLQVSADIFAKSTYRRQYGLVAQEMGCLLLYMEDYAAAGNWFDLGVREFEVLADRHNVELTRHYLSMAQIYNNQAEAAHNNCSESMDYWRKMGNREQYAHCQHTLAFIEGKLGEYDKAIALLEDNLVRLQDLPEGPWRDYREAKANELLRRIRGGEDLDQTSPTC